MQRVTLSDLAKELDLNKSTVSRALRGDSRISKATAVRVLELAELRGYQKNPSLAVLSEMRWRKNSKRSLMNWGFLITDLAIRHDESRIFMEYVKKYSADSGYSLDVIRLHESTTAKELNRLIAGRSLRGIIVNQIYLKSAIKSLDFSQVQAPGVCWVYSGNFFFNPTAHRVAESAFVNMMKALSVMRDKGFRQITFLYGSDLCDSRDTIRYCAAALSFQRQHSEMLINIVEINPQEEKDKLTRRIGNPEAFLLSQMVWYDFLTGPHRELPYATLYVSPENNHVSGITRMYEDMALTAVELLDVQVRRVLLGLGNVPRTTLVEGVWQDGTTLD